MSASSPQQSAHPRTTSPPETPSTSSYFSYPISRTVTGLLRRLSTDPGPPKGTQSSTAQQSAAGMEYTPPRRHYSPFQPPPLTPLTLKGYKSSTSEGSKLLTRTLGEEIRLLVPAGWWFSDERIAGAKRRTWGLYLGCLLYARTVTILW